MPPVKENNARVRTFQDILRILRERPEWLEELRRLILTEELLKMPEKLERLDRRFEKIEEDVAVLKQDVAVLKQDVAVLKQDVASLKGSDFERTIRERAPAYLGRLIRRCRRLSFEELAEKLEDAVDRGIITEDEKADVLLVDLVVTGKLKTGRDVMLAVEVSVKVDVEDVQRASRRAEVLRRALQAEAIGVAIGKERTRAAEKKAEELDVVLIK